MKKFLKGSKSKTTAPAAAPAAQSQTGLGHGAETPGYVVKEKDLSKLHKAAWAGDSIKIKQLTKKGDVNPLDKENRTPLHLACSKGHIDVIDILIACKAKLNMCDNDQRSPLMKAVQGNFGVCVETLLLNNADPNLVDKNGNTALHLAALAGAQDPTLFLLENGAMINSANKDGSTPLHLAAANKHDEVIDILLNEDVDVNATDNENRTPLMWACQTDQIGVVKVLLTNKADIDIKDSKGWTANDHAIMGGFHGCSHLIDEHISSRRPPSSLRSTGGTGGMFGSTAGTDALGFTLGGPAMDNFDDEDEDMSEGKSVAESWAASASEIDDPPVKPKMRDKKPSKPVKLTKFMSQDSDNESIHSNTSIRSTTSRSRIPRARSNSKESIRSATSTRSVRSDVSTTSISKIPRLKSPEKERRKGGATPTASPCKRPMKRRDTEEDEDEVTPRGGASVTPTPRESVISAARTVSDFDDDDDDLFPPSDNEKPKMSLMGKNKPNVSEMLNKLGMSDLDDDEEEEEEDNSWLTDTKKEKEGTVKRGIQPPTPDPVLDEPHDDNDSDSDWDSNDDLLPSEGSNTKEPAKQTGVQPTPEKKNSTQDMAKKNKEKVPVKAVSDISEDNWDTEEEDEEEEEEESEWERSGKLNRAQKKMEEERQKQMEEERQKQWEEEERQKKEKLLRDAEEELQREKEELARQAELERQQNEEERQRLEEERQRVEKERKKAEKEKEAAEERRRQEEETKRAEQEDKLKREEERMEEEIAREKQQLEEEKLRLEADNVAQEKRKREEEERREAERKEELKKERERMEMDLKKERERIEAERRQVEEERNKEAQRKQEAEQEMTNERDKEKKKLENERKEELNRIEEERKRLIEERNLEEKRRAEEKKELEEQRKANEQKLEQERQRLEEKGKQEDKTREKERQELEEEKQQAQLMLTAEREKLDTEKKKQAEEKSKIDELKRHFEMLRRQQEEEKRKMQAAKEEAEEKQRLEEERLKREEKRLEDERKRHEDARKQLEDELFKKRSATETDEEDRQAAVHHLDDERKRLEDERQRIEQQRKEFEEQQIKEKTTISTLERSMKEEKAKLEQSWRELDQRRQEMEETVQEKFNEKLNATGDIEEQRKKEAELASKAKEELQQEKQRLQEEREQLMNRTREMEKKRDELEEMKKMMRQRLEEQRKQREQRVTLAPETSARSLQETPGDHSVDQALNLYQQNIERRLLDEERSDTMSSVSQFDGMIDELTHEMESMKDQMEVSGPVLYSTMGQSMGMTAATDRTFIKLHNTSELGHPSGLVTGTRPLANSLPPSLLNHNAANSNKKQQPEWMGILSEADGLDYTSSEEGNGSTADEGGQLGTMPLLASTPIAPLTDIPRGSLDATLDATTAMQFQQALRDMRRRADREKSARLNAENRCKTLHSEKQDLYNKLMAVSEMKAGLESKLLDLESQIRTYAHRLDQETEKRSNAELILKKTKEQLIKREEIFTKEVEAKQRAELAARTIQVDLKSAANLIKQLEEERDELRKKAMSERNARLMHQDILQDQEEKEKMLKHETSKYHYEKAEAVARLEAADESRKAALSHNDRLKGDLYALKVEVERQRIHHQDNQGFLATENQELNNKIDELKSDIQVNEEALAHATMAFNAQLAAVRAENSKLYSKVERGDTERDRLQTELSSAKKLVNTTNIELEKTQLVRNDKERELRRKEEEWSRSAEKLNMELSSLKENTQSATRKLSNAESKMHRLENELQVTTATLRERSNQLSTLKRELDKGMTSQQSHDALLQNERSENARLAAKIESLQEKLTESKAHVASLRQALDAAKNENRDQNRETATVQDKLNSTLTTMQMENNRARTIWEEKQSNMAETMTRVKEDFRQSEHTRQLREQEVRQTQQELTEALRKLSIAEANLDIRKKALDDQQRDREGVKSEMKQVQDQVLNMQQERRVLETRIEELQNELLQAERNGMATSQQLVSTNKSLQKLSELEERLRHFQAENSRLEIVVKQLEERSEGLKTDLQESQKIRSGLEALVTTLKTSNLQIEGKLNEEFAARNIYAKEAEEHKDLWETEVKSRSRIGIRISQLEREKARMQADIEEERRQMRKVADVKKNLEIKYDGEMEKNRKLEQELNTAKSKMKLMRRKLKEQENPEMRFNTLQSEFERERINMDGTMANMRRQLEDVNQQLERENLLRMDLEKDNRKLQQEINSSKSALKNKDKLERTKRKLQDELSQTRMSMQHNYVEKGELERYKQDLDAKARSEINQKLEQVNSYLEQQSVARDRLEQIRQSGEEEAKKEMEDTITNLKTENGQLRTSIHELQAQKGTIEAEVARLKELHRREIETRERLGVDLDRTQNRLVDLTTRMTMDRHKTKHTRASSLDLTPSKSSPRGRASSPAPGVDLITEKVRSELDKSIERHLQAAPTEFGSSLYPERMSRDPLNNSLSASALGLSHQNNYMSVLRKNYFV